MDRQHVTRERVVAAMEVLGCEPAWDERTSTRYCREHMFPWLRDIDACPRAERVTEAVLSVQALRGVVTMPQPVPASERPTPAPPLARKRGRS